jgi:hypothetical protein
MSVLEYKTSRSSIRRSAQGIEKQEQRELGVRRLMKWGFLSVSPHTTTIHIRLLYRLVHRESGVKDPSTSSNIEICSPTAMVQIILFSKNN